MDTGRFGIPINMRQMNGGLFNHSVHLSRRERDGSDLHQVTNVDPKLPNAEFSDGHPAFSPDGKTLVFVREHRRKVPKLVKLGEEEPFYHAVFVQSLDSSGSLVHLQDRCWVVSYSTFHEIPNLCMFVIGEGARTPSRGAALEGRLHLAPMPDLAGQFERGRGSEDRLEPRMRPANGSERHPRLRPEWSGRSHARILTPQKDPRLLRPEERPSLARDAPPLAEGVRIRHEPVDSGDVRGDRLRGGAHPKAGLGGDHT